ncbi:MAG: hypothetical protein KGL69_03335 [Alphaproteobacteria bacterium]|nr:hypothetical protein [Alphaproteobacteria bacterium]
MVAELLILGWRAPGRRGELLLALAPGFCLALALRAAVGDDPGGHPQTVGWVGLCLLAALPFHLADLSRRGLLTLRLKSPHAA